MKKIGSLVLFYINLAWQYHGPRSGSIPLLEAESLLKKRYEYPVNSNREK
jgi:hypothetical protein